MWWDFFVDFKKTFSAIGHKLLLQKLGRCGIRGVAQSQIQSYFDSRYQYHQPNNTVSDFSRGNCGVPQGSILGPK